MKSITFLPVLQLRIVEDPLAPREVARRGQSAAARGSAWWIKRKC